MKLRHLTAIALGAALLAACGGPPQEQAERPFQVTPELATPDPNVFGGGNQGSQGGAYPAPTGEAGAAGYPGPAAQAPSGYPAPDGAAQEQTFGRSRAAIVALPDAEAAAKADFSQTARLIAIMPSRVMLLNVGQPPVEPGWFYKFRTDGSEREFIVHVAGDVVTGGLETQPMEPPSPAELPIPLDRVTVDSDKVYELFAQRAPQLGLTVANPLSFDLELVYLEGSAGPVWSVYNPDNATWLMSVDASTGQEVPNPRG